MEASQETWSPTATAAGISWGRGWSAIGNRSGTAEEGAP
jgi:hypothetical protein